MAGVVPRLHGISSGSRSPGRPFPRSVDKADQPVSPRLSKAGFSGVRWGKVLFGGPGGVTARQQNTRLFCWWRQPTFVGQVPGRRRFGSAEVPPNPRARDFRFARDHWD